MTAETKYPATYRILLRGFLEKEWSDRLNGLTISTTSEQDEPCSMTWATPCCRLTAYRGEQVQPVSGRCGLS